MKKRIIIGTALVSLLLGGCYDFKDFENIRVEPISPAYVFPLVNSTISFRELVERSGTNTLVEVLPGTTMFYMAFRDTQHLFSADELFQFSSLSFNQSIGIPSELVPTNFPAGTQIPTFHPSFSENINPVMGAELKEVHLTGGNLSVMIVNHFNHQVSGILRIRSLKNSNGVVFVLPFNLSTYSSSVSDNRSISNFVLSLYNSDTETYNVFDFEADVTITSSGHPSTDGSLDISVDIQGPEYGLLIGKFNSTFQNDYLKYQISVFNATLLADQYFEEPSLSFTVNNSFGMPVSLSLPKFEFRNENSGIIIPITNTGTIDNGLSIGTPNVLQPISTPQEDFVSSHFILNPQNSNITDAFALAPNALSMATHFNLGNDTDDHSQFLRSNSKIDLISEIVLPLYGRITTHVLSDTLANFQWPELFEENNAAQDGMKIMLKFKFSNELPFDMAFQAEFLDGDGNVVDHFFGEDHDEWFIESAPVGANGESVGTNSKYSTLEITKDRYLELSQSNSIVFYYRLHTGGEEGTSVKVLSTNRIKVQLSVYATVSIDLDN